MFKKSEVTRERLLQVALKLFAENGFEATTMRVIATEANVAPSALYYYFDSKESVIHEYYKQSHIEHEKIVADFLQNQSSFSKRLHYIVKTKIEVAMPYKKMASALYQTAANPQSPLSPFSTESKEVRLQSLKLFQNVVDGSNDKFHEEIKKLLPEFLWLYQMGIVLFWIYDHSHHSTKTFELIDKTVPLISLMNRLISSPLGMPFRKKLISVLRSFVPDLN